MDYAVEFIGWIGAQPWRVHRDSEYPANHTGGHRDHHQQQQRNKFGHE